MSVRAGAVRSLIYFAMVAVATGLVRGAEKAAVEPLALAHAHNDYLHERPLLDALDHGFTSVEADIFLVDDKLLVAHAKSELKGDRSLEALYLDPLRQRVLAGGGSVYPGGKPFNLLIDIKSDGETTYAALARVLAQYADIVSAVRDGHLEAKAINVVISGNRPRATMAAERVRFAGVDGRFVDLDSDAPVNLVPLVSDNWVAHFAWRGKGPIAESDRTKLRDAVAKAHAHGRRIRLWGTADNPDVWRELRAAGVDMINTDDLRGLEKFLRDSSQ